MEDNQPGGQTRAMVDTQCKEGQTSNTLEQQPVPEATSNPTPNNGEPNTKPGHPKSSIKPSSRADKNRD